jgi:hypothetical protein
MNKIRKALFPLLVMVSGFFAACTQESENGISYLQVSLTDTPGVYDHVFIHIVGVEVQTSQNGWQSLPTDSGIYDLLLLQNGIDTTLVPLQSLPSGRVNQIRLMLGDSNTVVVDSITYPLSLSSQDESGLKLNLNSVLQPNTSYDLVLDFDAGQSVLQTGNGTYKLKPVIRAALQ